MWQFCCLPSSLHVCPRLTSYVLLFQEWQRQKNISLPCLNLSLWASMSILNISVQSWHWTRLWTFKNMERQLDNKHMRCLYKNHKKKLHLIIFNPNRAYSNWQCVRGGVHPGPITSLSNRERQSFVLTFTPTANFNHDDWWEEATVPGEPTRKNIPTVKKCNVLIAVDDKQQSWSGFRCNWVQW